MFNAILPQIIKPSQFAIGPKDIENKDQVHALFGALLELRSLLREKDDYSHSYLALKGKVGFAEAFALKK